jgi:predicted aldo/keto reductase-like oxidoreductase
MKYRNDPKYGNRLSALGFGCMRFPRGMNAMIDVDKTERLVLSAVERGVNYFDTAYVYGGSEQALGEVLKRNPGVRERIFIATKLPHGQCKTYADFDRIFNTQLERLRTGRIDYYLIHNLPSMAAWEAVKSLGIERWIAEKKAGGQIGQIGFSFHGIQSEFMALLDAYDWDFCQIQYNYMNINYQAGRAGLLRASEKGMAVIVMEPLLGGKLANPPKKAARILTDANSGISPAAWALRWIWNQEEATVVLSGMNGMEQLDDNIQTAEESPTGCMTGREAKAIADVVAVFEGAYKIPCTGCNYCVPCPAGVNIPGCFAGYNASHAAGFITGMTQYLTGTRAYDPATSASGAKCVKCGQCEKKCPQHIEIIKSLEAATARMEPFWFRAGVKVFNAMRK